MIKKLHLILIIILGSTDITLAMEIQSNIRDSISRQPADIRLEYNNVDSDDDQFELSIPYKSNELYSKQTEDSVSENKVNSKVSSAPQIKNNRKLSWQYLPRELQDIIIEYTPKDVLINLSHELFVAIEQQKFNDIVTLIALNVHKNDRSYFFDGLIRDDVLINVSSEFKLKYNRNKLIILKYLIAHGADINKPAIFDCKNYVKRQLNSVHAAVHHMNIPALQILIEHKAQLNLKCRDDKKYKTPLDIVTENLNESYDNICGNRRGLAAARIKFEKNYTLASMLQLAGAVRSTTKNIPMPAELLTTEDCCSSLIASNYYDKDSSCFNFMCCSFFPCTIGCCDQHVQIPSTFSACNCCCINDCDNNLLLCNSRICCLACCFIGMAFTGPTLICTKTI